MPLRGRQGCSGKVSKESLPFTTCLFLKHVEVLGWNMIRGGPSYYVWWVDVNVPVAMCHHPTHPWWRVRSGRAASSRGSMLVMCRHVTRPRRGTRSSRMLKLACLCVPQIAMQSTHGRWVGRVAWCVHSGSPLPRVAWWPATMERWVRSRDTSSMGLHLPHCTLQVGHSTWRICLLIFLCTVQLGLSGE
jgi:hypothetical protein